MLCRSKSQPLAYTVNEVIAMQQRITADTQTWAGTLKYDDTVVLTYKIEFPQFSSRIYAKAAQRMNTYYESSALSFLRYIKKTMYHQAVEQYIYSKENGYPVMVFEAEQVYTITLTANRYVSLYTDQYTYTGGAHGSTVRSSETWGLPLGRQIPLGALFPRGFDYRTYIINMIIREIQRQNAAGDSVYFDDYPENVRNTFQENQFYLTPQGIVVYFQQYDIAPYSTGIPEFLIPYSRKL